MKRLMSKDRWISVGAIAFSAIIYFMATKFPKSVLDKIGPSLFPQFLAGIIAACSVILFITAGPDKRTDEERAADWEKFKGKDWLGLLITLADLVFFLFAFKRLGFILTSIIFTMVSVLYFDKDRPLKQRLIHGAIFAVVFTAIIYLLFAKVLRVLLPTILL